MEELETTILKLTLFFGVAILQISINVVRLLWKQLEGVKLAWATTWLSYFLRSMLTFVIS